MFANKKMERLADLKKISQNSCQKENGMFFIFSPISTKSYIHLGIYSILRENAEKLAVGGFQPEALCIWGTLTYRISCAQF